MNGWPYSLVDEFNQNFQFFYKKSAISEKFIQTLVNELVTIGFVKKIHRMEKPRKFVTYSNTDWPKKESIYSAMPDLEGNSDLYKSFL